jgi:hypothetical protein
MAYCASNAMTHSASTSAGPPVTSTVGFATADPISGRQRLSADEDNRGACSVRPPSRPHHPVQHPPGRRSPTAASHPRASADLAVFANTARCSATSSSPVVSNCRTGVPVVRLASEPHSTSTA